MMSLKDFDFSKMKKDELVYSIELMSNVLSASQKTLVSETLQKAFDKKVTREGVDA